MKKIILLFLCLTFQLNAQDLELLSKSSYQPTELPPQEWSGQSLFVFANQSIPTQTKSKEFERITIISPSGEKLSIPFVKHIPYITSTISILSDNKKLVQQKIGFVRIKPNDYFTINLPQSSEVKTTFLEAQKNSIPVQAQNNTIRFFSDNDEVGFYELSYSYISDGLNEIPLLLNVPYITERFNGVIRPAHPEQIQGITFSSSDNPIDKQVMDWAFGDGGILYFKGKGYIPPKVDIQLSVKQKYTSKLTQSNLFWINIFILSIILLYYIFSGYFFNRFYSQNIFKKGYSFTMNPVLSRYLILNKVDKYSICALIYSLYQKGYVSIVKNNQLKKTTSQKNLSFFEKIVFEELFKKETIRISDIPTSILVKKLKFEIPSVLFLIQLKSVIKELLFGPIVVLLSVLLFKSLSIDVEQIRLLYISGLFAIVLGYFLFFIFAHILNSVQRLYLSVLSVMTIRKNILPKYTPYLIAMDLYQSKKNQDITLINNILSQMEA